MKYTLKLIFTIIAIIIAFACISTGVLIPVAYGIGQALNIMWKKD